MNGELPDIGGLVTGLGGGLALFLYGMQKMTESLKTATGGHMKEWLATLTTNRVSGAVAGALVTAVIQSSSVTTVMVVGFVSAGLMTFGQSVGVIMGANVGTTITSQIIAFRVTDYALLLITAGFLTELLARTRRLRHVGIMVMGLGLLFFGMDLMSSAALPLRTYEPFLAFVQELRNPVLGVMVGLLFTTIVQSSSATTGVVIVLASQGLIPLETGITLVLGANVGTCVTVLLAAMGKPTEAVRAAMVHVTFNLGGVLLFIGFVPQFAALVRDVSPQAIELAGQDRLAADVPRQIANAHTLFNVANTALFLVLSGLLVRVVERIVPVPRTPTEGPGIPKYLHPMYLTQPAVALDRVRQELGRLGGLVSEMAAQATPLALAGTDDALDRLQGLDDDVDRLHEAIVDYLGQLSLQDLVEPEADQIQACLSVANHLESIGDIVGSDFVATGRKRLELSVELRADVEASLRAAHDAIAPLVPAAVGAFVESNSEEARRVRGLKGTLSRQADHVRLQLAEELAHGGRSGLATYRLGLDTLEELRRVYRLTRRIAHLAQGPTDRTDATRPNGDD